MMLIKLVKKHSKIQFSPKIQRNRFQTHRKLSDDELDSKYLRFILIVLMR